MNIKRQVKGRLGQVVQIDVNVMMFNLFITVL